jgi:hypothetical protein
VVVRLGAHRISACVVIRGNSVWQEESERSDEAPIDAVLEELLARMPKGMARTMIFEIEAPLVQVRRLESLPPVRAGELQRLVEHQASSFFRKNGHPLVTDATWLAPGHEGARRALLAAMDLGLAESLDAVARRAGLELESVAPADLPEAKRFDLRPAQAKAREARTGRGALIRLGAITALLWAIALACWLGRFELALRRTQHELDGLAGARLALLKGKEVEHRAAEMIATLAPGSMDRHRLQDQMQALLASIPDSAYLTSFALDTLGSGLLSGGARRTTDVLARLEHTPEAINPRQGGSSVPDPESGPRWERLTIRLGSPPR